MSAKQENAAALDQQFLWHPFTPMAEWTAPEHEPLVLVEGHGVMLRDQHGREYIDGNSSIWTNIHGHNHPRINAAIKAQLDKVAHTSFLGFSNEPAALLGKRLVEAYPGEELQRVFYSDDGSTAIEVALKLAIQFWQQSGEPQRTGFVAFERAYHGDTMGASSLGGVALFHNRFSKYQFPVEFIDDLDGLTTIEKPQELAAVIIEPLIRGVAGMRPWPQGMLRELRSWCDAHGVLLIADEIMTGFGRTGTLFACPQEDVVPDMVALAKGITGGYLPLAATLINKTIYSAFLGGPDKTFYYGHSYTANPLGCAAALASLDVFEEEQTLPNLQPKIQLMQELLAELSQHPNVIDVRQLGFIAGIEIGNPDGSPFDQTKRTGAAACLAARNHGLLTRPILDTITLMPPLCITGNELSSAVMAIMNGISIACNRT